MFRFTPFKSWFCSVLALLLVTVYIWGPYFGRMFIMGSKVPVLQLFGCLLYLASVYLFGEISVLLAIYSLILFAHTPNEKFFTKMFTLLLAFSVLGLYVYTKVFFR